jgi:hypothetical protein
LETPTARLQKNGEQAAPNRKSEKNTQWHWFPWWLSRRAGASAPTTSTPVCCATTSSFLARPSTTRWPISSWRRCSFSQGEDPEKDVLALHQLARRLHHRGPGHLRHHAVHQEQRGHLLHRPGGQHGRVSAAGRHQGQALRPAQLAHSHSSAVDGRIERPGHRHRHSCARDSAHPRDHQQPDRQAHRPAARPHRARRRAGLHHERAAGQGIRHRRRNHRPAAHVLNRRSANRVGRKPQLGGDRRAVNSSKGSNT